MTDSGAETPPATGSWDTYWDGAHDSAAFTGGGTSHPLVLSFWNDFFGEVAAAFDGPAIIDLASGNGAVVECAKAVLGELPPFTCVDVSPAAIAMLEQRFPEVRGIVADAVSLPFDDASFDIATSQFGIEYAGPGARAELGRVVAPGGRVALLLHHRDGAIHAQCAASHDAVTRMQQARFIPLCIEAFEAGFAALHGGDRDRYRAALGNLAPAIRSMETIMAEHGRDVADQTIVRLYRDVRSMMQRLSHYEPDEVLGWLARMEGEIDAYAGRMGSMCEVAIDRSGFESLTGELRAGGLRPLRADPLASDDQPVPLAWALVAEKPPG